MLTARGPMLLIRADGGGPIGLGHIMRCLALSQAWRLAGGSVAMVCHQIPTETKDRLMREGIELVDSPYDLGSELDASNLARLADYHRATVVIDGYSFNAAFQRTVSQSFAKLMVVDDFGQIGTYHANAILDQNLDTDPGTYRQRPANCSVLLGPRYALLRSEFLGRPRPRRQEFGPQCRVFVTFGGSDRTGEAAKVVQALASLDTVGIKVKVAVGAGSPSAHRLDELARRVDWVDVEHDVADMASLMAWADLAVSAAGSACWEFAYMGVPMLLISIAANQVPIAASLAARGVAVNLGPHKRVDAGDIVREVNRLLQEPRRLQIMSSRSSELIDGHGARRVAEVLIDRGAG